MKVIVTCGPGYEPIDKVRRLTNFSTGELGVLLSNRFARAGAQVVCLKGVGATCSIGLEAQEQQSFTTSGHLRELLESLSMKGEADAVFHAAALSDFRVAEVRDSDGNLVGAGKISSRQPKLTLTLEPAPKLIASLRGWFPDSRIVGWKYEVDGTREEAIAKATTQIVEHGLNACVVNGEAFGNGFGFCETAGLVASSKDKAQLCDYLLGWMTARS